MALKSGDSIPLDVCTPVDNCPISIPYNAPLIFGEDAPPPPAPLEPWKGRLCHSDYGGFIAVDIEDSDQMSVCNYGPSPYLRDFGTPETMLEMWLNRTQNPPLPPFPPVPPVPPPDVLPKHAIWRIRVTEVVSPSTVIWDQFYDFMITSYHGATIGDFIGDFSGGSIHNWTMNATSTSLTFTDNWPLIHGHATYVIPWFQFVGQYYLPTTEPVVGGIFAEFLKRDGLVILEIKHASVILLDFG